MDKTLAAELVIAVLVVLLVLMVLSWNLRKRRQKAFPSLEPAPDGIEPTLFEGLYLSTTPTGDPLNRVAVRGLGFRERGSVGVAAEGLVILGDKFIPAASIRSIGRASWTIDRGVEPEGLSVVSWTLGDAELDSYFRLADPEGFLAATARFTKAGKK